MMSDESEADCTTVQTTGIKELRIRNENLGMEFNS